MSFIDTNYINLVSSRLRNFKKKKDYLYNFSCPYCGDSLKNKLKARGYFYRKENKIIFKCHNCGVGRSLSNFLKEQAPDLYDQYLIERYRNNFNKVDIEENFTFAPPKFEKNIFSQLPLIKELNRDHIARIYLEERKIPEQYYNKLYFAENFSEWAATHDKDINIKGSRIIIPFVSNDGTIYGYQGRSIDKLNSYRYVTVTLNPNYPKIYGLDNLDFSKKVYITEGPFDSMFLDNAIAMGGSDLNISNILKKENVVFIFDNEPRNKQIVEKISKAVEGGYSTVIWDNTIHEKDINDMILVGRNVKTIIKNRTYSGLEAKVKLLEWKRI